MQWTSKLKTSHTWGKYHVENPLKCIYTESKANISFDLLSV